MKFRKSMAFFLSPVALAGCYGVFLFLYEIKFLRQIVPAVHPWLIGWAAAQIIHHFPVCRKKVPFLPLILAFAVSALITGVSRAEAGLLRNGKGWVMTLLPLLAFYPACFFSEQREKAVLKALLGASAVVFFSSAVSVALYLIRISREVTLFGITELIGYRLYDPSVADSGIILYGVYEDTNHAAAYAALFGVYSLALLRACRREIFHRRWQNLAGTVFAVANLAAQAAYFPLANSRGGWLALGAGVCAGVFLYMRRVSAKGWLQAAWLSALTVAAVVIVLVGIRGGLSRISLNMEGNAVPAASISETDSQEQDSFQKDSAYFAGGRLGIWREGIYLFKHYPIFGTGPGNNQYFARKHFDSGTLIYGKALHNSFLDALVDYGTVGFVLLMAFWLAAAAAVLKSRTWSETKCAAAAAVTVAVCAGMVLSSLFINTTAMYFALTVLTGYLMPKGERGPCIS